MVVAPATFFNFIGGIGAPRQGRADLWEGSAWTHNRREKKVSEWWVKG